MSNGRAIRPLCNLAMYFVRFIEGQPPVFASLVLTSVTVKPKDWTAEAGVLRRKRGY
jgi:hypothetical protein